MAYTPTGNPAGRPKKTIPQEGFLSFPVLYALSGQPMNIGQLCRKFLVSRMTMLKRVKHLEKLGFIIQRADNRWQAIVQLEAKMPTPGVESQEKTAEGEPVRVVLAVPAVPPTPLPEAERVGEHPVAVAKPTLEKPSAKLAIHFNVPEEIPDVGVLTVGGKTKCSCGAVTVLRYGGVPLCVRCARETERGMDVQD